MGAFYPEVLRRLLKKKVLRRDMRILVLCGGKYDQEVLQQTGFHNVTIANLDSRLKGDEFAPYAWSFQDAEKLTFADNEFDFCLVHEGLHHCSSPHRALLELYRVAKSGVLIFEPRDSITARLAVRLNFAQDYEVAAVFGNTCQYGGVGNTEIPNFVFRWTERDVEKTIKTYAPHAPHQFLYFYGMWLPWGRLRAMKNKLWLLLFTFACPFLYVAKWFYPKISNTIAFVVLKPALPAELHPWLRLEHGQFKLNQAWVLERYR
jgi:SAM-dependent methyltransferase